MLGARCLPFNVSIAGSPVDTVQIHFLSKVTLSPGERQITLPPCPKLKGDLIDEFFDKGFSQAGWDATPDFVTEIKYNAEV